MKKVMPLIIGAFLIVLLSTIAYAGDWQTFDDFDRADNLTGWGNGWLHWKDGGTVKWNITDNQGQYGIAPQGSNANFYRTTTNQNVTYRFDFKKNSARWRFKTHALSNKYCAGEAAGGGFCALWAPDSFTFYRDNSNLGSFAYALDTNWHSCRFGYNGSHVVFKVWNMDETEPLNWNFTVASTGLDRTLVAFETAYPVGNIVDNITFWNESITPPDTTPPIIFNYTVTSGNVVSGESTTAWNENGTINITSRVLSFNFTTNETANCSCRLDVEQNYTKMVADNENYKIGTTETTDHSCMLYDNVSMGNHCVYSSCIDMSGNEPASGNSTSGCLNLTRINSPPNQTTPVLNSTYGTNFDHENLTCYNQSTYDSDGDEVVNIYNWFKNNEPLTVLNMPFEGGSSSTDTKDYSGKGNDGSVVEATWSSTAGIVGGAYEFDGIGDYISLSSQISFDDGDNFTISLWYKGTDTEQNAHYGKVLVGRNNNDLWSNLVLRSGYVEYIHYDGSWQHNVISSTMVANYSWHQIVFVNYGSTKTGDLWIDGIKEVSGESTVMDNELYPFRIDYLMRGWNNKHTNGTIDEVKVYPYALTPEQVYQNYLDAKDGFTNSRTIVSNETTPGEEYMCQITPNDGYVDGDTLNSSELLVVWGITFNVTSGEDGLGMPNLDDISCNYTGFSWDNDTTNPYGPYGFPSGNWECTFKEWGYYDKTQTFTADNDTTVDVIMEAEKMLTIQEHFWLKDIYNCLYQGDCAAMNLLLNINQTTTNTWDKFKRTDQTVVIKETITNYNISATSNISIDYTVNVPTKEDYKFLPMKLSYWFLDESNTTCYNKGDKPTGIETPYCNPLIAQTVGQVNTQTNFTIWISPSLPEGSYTLVRDIEIDPPINGLPRWIKYGQEIIGTIQVLETRSESSINLVKTGEILVPKSQVKQEAKQEPAPTTGMVVKEIVERKVINTDEVSSLISMMKYIMGMMVMLVVVVAGLLVYLFINKRR